MTKNTLLKAALALFFAFIIWAILSANFGWPNPFYGLVKALPFGDKVGHFILMGTLSFLVNLVLNARSIQIAGRSVLLGSVLVLTFVTLEELSQGFLPTRTLSLTDWLADFSGIWFFGRMAAYQVAKIEKP